MGSLWCSRKMSVQAGTTTIPLSHRRLASRRGRSYGGTGKCFTKAHASSGCGAICGLRHLGPVWTESDESRKIPILRAHFHRVHHEGVATGPSTFVQWRTSFRILRTALAMLDAVSLAVLHNYEMVIEKPTRPYPTAWHLVYAADELARSAHSNRIRAKVLMDTRAGKDPPASWDPKRPWDYVFLMIALDDTFWTSSDMGCIRKLWIPEDTRGTVGIHLMGGVRAITPQVETDAKEDGENYNTETTTRAWLSTTATRRGAAKQNRKPGKVAWLVWSAEGRIWEGITWAGRFSNTWVGQ